MYLSYDQYLEMGGELDRTTFSHFERKAEFKINYYTQDRVKKQFETLSDDFKRAVQECIFQFIELFEKTDSTVSQGLSSYSNGVESFSFNTDYSIDTSLYEVAVEILPIELISALVD